MRVLMLLVFSLLSYVTIAKKVKGYIIYKGDTTEAIFYVKFAFGEPSLTGNHEKIEFKYKESDIQVLKLKPRRGIQVNFSYKNKAYKFVSLREYNWVGNSDYGFVMLGYQGHHLSVVDAVSVDHSTDHYPNAHKNHSVVKTFYSAQKGYLSVGSFGFKKRIKAYFSDCPRALELISEFGFDNVNLEEIVDVYDACVKSDK